MDRRTLDCWTGHEHLYIVDNSTSFDEKIRRAVTRISKLVGVPAPLAVTRKFLLVRRPTTEELKERLMKFEEFEVRAESPQTARVQTARVQTARIQTARVRWRGIVCASHRARATLPRVGRPQRGGPPSIVDVLNRTARMHRSQLRQTRARLIHVGRWTKPTWRRTDPTSAAASEGGSREPTSRSSTSCGSPRRRRTARLRPH